MGAWSWGFLIDLHLFGVKISPLSCLRVYSVPVLAFLFLKRDHLALKPGKGGGVGGDQG